jgi:predicted nucleic acid-binding protein
VILIDTSSLIDSLCAPHRSLPTLRRLIAAGEEIALSSLVYYEWLRGPRTAQQLEDQELLLPRERLLGFGAAEAALAAELYLQVPRARGREIDLAIAAVALTHDAALWTLNPEDFRDIPRLELVEATD